MPTAPPRPCRRPGCSALVRAGYCDAHRPAPVDRRHRDRDYNSRRDPGDAFYGSGAWRNLRDTYARQHPLCCECERHGRTVLMAIVDHVVPRKERPDLSLDWNNLRSLCRTCHNRIGRQVRRGNEAGKVV